MTEKRFVAIGVEWTDGFIQDHISDRDLFNIGAVCNLLNDLSEENTQLKKKLQIYKSDGLETLNDLQRCYENAKKSMKRINVLEEENGQLKQEIDTIRAIKNDILTKALEQGVELL